MSPRTLTSPPTDRAMWRRLLALVHPDRAGDHELIIWCREVREHVAGDAIEPPVYDRREELERMGQEHLQLEERAEEQAAGLVATLEELLAFDRRHRRALTPAGFSVYDAPPDLAGEISWWFRGLLWRSRARPRIRRAGPRLREGGAVPAGAGPADTDC